MKSKRKYILSISLPLLAILLLVGLVGLNLAFAQTQPPPGGPLPPPGSPPPPSGSPSPPSAGCPPGQSGSPCRLDNPAPEQLVDIRDFGVLLTRIIQIFLYFAGGIAVLFLMIGGFQYVAARGNEEGTEKAKKTITGAVIGIIIIVMAFAIVAIVNNLLTSDGIGGGNNAGGGGTQSGTLQAGQNCNTDSECVNGLVCVSSSPSEPRVCQ